MTYTIMVVGPWHCPSWEGDGDPPSSSHPCTHKRFGCKPLPFHSRGSGPREGGCLACCTCIGDSYGLPLPGGLDHCGRSPKTHIHLLYLVDQAHVAYVHGCGWMRPVCNAPASYHEYVTERPPPRHAQHRQALSDSFVGPLPANAREHSSVHVRRGGTDPSERKNGARIERPGPGGTRLDRALCVNLSGDHLGWQPEHGGRKKKVSLSVHSRPIKRSKHAGPLGTLHAAHVGRGGGGSWAFALS